MLRFTAECPQNTDNMRFFSVYTVIGGLAMANIVLGGDEDEWKSPEYKSFFEFPLPIPPEITPLEYVILRIIHVCGEIAYRSA